MPDYDKIFDEACLKVLPYLFIPNDIKFRNQLAKLFDSAFASLRTSDFPTFLETVRQVDSVIDEYSRNDKSNTSENILTFYHYTRPMRETLRNLDIELKDMKKRLVKLEKKRAVPEQESESPVQSSEISIGSGTELPARIIGEADNFVIPDAPTHTDIETILASLTQVMKERWEQIRPLFGTKGYVTLNEVRTHILSKVDIESSSIPKLLRILIKNGLLTQKGKGAGAKYYPTHPMPFGGVDLSDISTIDGSGVWDKAPEKVVEYEYIKRYISENNIVELKNKTVQAILAEKFVSLYRDVEQKHVHAIRVLKALVDDGYFIREGKARKTKYIRTAVPITN